MDDPVCVFCRLLLDPGFGRWRSPDGKVVGFLDRFPSTPGHTLVVPRRHVSRLTDLSIEERSGLWGLALQVIGSFDDPDGFTVGVNDGQAAGQTVPHVHLHVIPRRLGDVEDPRGGVRWVIPATAAYWAS